MFFKSILQKIVGLQISNKENSIAEAFLYNPTTFSTKLSICQKLQFMKILTWEQKEAWMVKCQLFPFLGQSCTYWINSIIEIATKFMSSQVTKASKVSWTMSIELN